MDKGDHGVGRGDRYFFCSIFNLFIVPYGNEGCVLVVLKKIAQQHELFILMQCQCHGHGPSKPYNSRKVAFAT